MRVAPRAGMRKRGVNRGLYWQTIVTAPIERKRLLDELANVEEGSETARLPSGWVVLFAMHLRVPIGEAAIFGGLFPIHRGPYALARVAKGRCVMVTL